MMNPLRLLLVIASLFMLGACGKNSLENYYYPIGQLSSGLVYEYINPETSETVDYVYVQSLRDTDKQWWLVLTYYTPDFQQYTIVKEKKLKDGTSYEDYMFLLPDSTGKLQNYRVKIDGEKAAFPFNPPQDSTTFYRFAMQFSLPPDMDLLINFTGDRWFRGYTEHTFEGKTEQVAVFERKERRVPHDPKVGGVWEELSTRKEYYAKGIGLVYYEKTRTDRGQQITEKQQLKARYSMDEFIKKSEGSLLQ
ncbi:MAG: hypothetical protein MK212_02535 [Saprospiraceae bacterium]|nr:hypothetical protein [Saprospiraceae bacterium]